MRKHIFKGKDKRNEGLYSQDSIYDRDDNFTLQIQNLLFSGQRRHCLKRGGDSVAERLPIEVKYQQDVHVRK